MPKIPVIIQIQVRQDAAMHCARLTSCSVFKEPAGGMCHPVFLLMTGGLGRMAHSPHVFSMDPPLRLLRLRFFANVVGQVACLVAGGGSLKTGRGAVCAGWVRGAAWAARAARMASMSARPMVGMSSKSSTAWAWWSVSRVARLARIVLDAVEIGLGEEVAVPHEEEVGLGEAAECCAGVGEVGGSGGRLACRWHLGGGCP